MMHPKTRLAIIAGVVSVLVLVPIIAIALGVGLGVGLSDSGGGSSPQTDPYVLKDTTIIFGALTPAGRGSVRLSARDSHVYASSFRGLGLLPESSQLPAFWRITPASSMTNMSVSHWSWPSGLVAEGVNATTPAPSAAGYAARLNGTTYKFLVEAFTKDNRAFKSALLTINIDKTALNIGTFDPLVKGWYPLGRGVNAGTLAINTIYLSTGIDCTTNRITLNDLRFSKTVTIRHADLSRPGGIVNLGFSNCSNVLVTNITFVGSLKLSSVSTVGGIVAFNGGSTNMAVRFCSGFFTNEEATLAVAFVQFGGCINCEASDNYAYRLNSGIVDKTGSKNINITVARFRMRQFYANALWIGNSVNLTFIDCVTMAAMRYTGDHIDHLQVANGAAPQGLKIIRHQMYKAEGGGGSQGFFGGAAGVYQGFIDDGSGNGSPSTKAGNVLTIMKNDPASPILTNAWLRGYNFSQLIQVTEIVGGKYIIDKTLLAPPGIVHTAPFNGLTIQGLAYTGFMHDALWLRGGGGSASVKAYTATLVNLLPDETRWTYFTGTVSPAGLMVTKFQSGPPMATFVIELADGTPLKGTGSAPLLTPVGGNGTGAEGFYPWQYSNVNISYPTPIAMRGASDLPKGSNQGPGADMNAVDMPSMWPPTLTISSLYVSTSLNNQPGYRSYLGGPAVKPANLIIDAASTVWNKGNSTFASACFAQGDPQLGPQGLEPITAAQWEAMSFDEVLKRNVQALTPRVGGPLTSGTTDFGAFTRTGLWNDGSGKRPY